MKKTTTILLSLFIGSVTSTAQSFDWVKQLGGATSDYGYAVTTDASGNVYTTGAFKGTADFDPGSGTMNLTSNGSFDIFISKLDAAGNFVWAKHMGGTGSDHGESIITDASGNVYTTGGFRATVDFDPGSGTSNLTSSGNDDIFVSKFDASGNFIWAKKMGGNSDDIGISIATDASGNVYTTGEFWSTADFDPGSGTFNYSSNGSGDVFISKLDASGNFVWAKQMGGTGSDHGESIITDASGNLFVTGDFALTVDFDPGTGTFDLISNGYQDIYISKLDESGNLVWAKQTGGIGYDYSNSITMDASGNLYTTGNFTGTADFDPGAGTFNLTPFGGSDIFVSKMDASANLIWAKKMGGISNDEGNSITLDNSGNVYTSGYFYETADFDPGAGTFNITSTGYNDIFVTKLDATGDFVWAKKMGGTDYDRGVSITADASENIYLTGFFGGTADFDPESGTFNLTSNGEQDVFIHKMSSTLGINQYNLDENVTLYPNPATQSILLEGLDKAVVSLKFVSVYGEVLLTKEMSSDITFDLPSGTYFIIIEFENHSRLTKKLIIN